jgi:uncharacterized membrane protein
MVKKRTTAQRLDTIERKVEQVRKLVTIRKGTEDIKELDELENIAQIERDIEKKLSYSPLKRVTHQDITKGVIGAFFGVVGHFSFKEGIRIGQAHSLMNSTVLLLTSFLIIIAFIYFAGFREVREKFFFKILPLRAITIYASAIITTIFVLFIYGEITLVTPLEQVFSSVAAISVLAVLGAGTADLLGK